MIEGTIKNHICMILDKDFPPDIRVEKEIHTLQNAGFRVTLITISYKRNKRHENIGGINVYRIFGDKFLYQISALAFTFPLFHYLIYKKVKGIIKDFSPDFLHVHDMVIAPAIFKASSKLNIPIVLDLHENRPAIMQLYAHVKQFPGKYLINLDTWKKSQSLLQKRANRLILVTDEAKNHAVKREGIEENKIYVVPNTVEKNFSLSLSDSAVIKEKFKGKFCVLYFGDTALRRGTDDIIQAMSLLKDQIRNLHAIIVGKGSEDHKLLALANELKVLDMISFEGWQDVRNLKAYAKVSSIGICPFKRNLHHDTTFANKLFQFMGLGLPLLVSDCPAQVHVVEKYNCGLVHQAGNPRDIANKILQLNKDRRLRDKLGGNGIVAIKKELNWEKTSTSLIKLYNSFSI